MIEVRRNNCKYVIMSKEWAYGITNRRDKWIGEIVHEDADFVPTGLVNVRTVSIVKPLGVGDTHAYDAGRIYTVRCDALIPVPYPTWQPEYDEVEK